MNKKHFFLMLACCLIPIIGLALVFLLKIPLNTVLFGGLILVCPISMIVMMMLMSQEHDASHSKDPPQTAVKDVLHTHHEGQ